MDVDPVVDYMARLELALARVPSPRKEQLLAEIADHIAESRTELENPTSASLTNLLERIGRPEDIAAEAMEAEPQPPLVKRKKLAYATLGAFIVVGAAIAIAVAILTPVGLTTAPGGPQSHITAKVQSVVALDPSTIRVYIDWVNSGKAGGQVTCSVEVTIRNRAGADVGTALASTGTNGDITPGALQNLHHDIRVITGDAEFVTRSDVRLVHC